MDELRDALATVLAFALIVACIFAVFRVFWAVWQLLV